MMVTNFVFVTLLPLNYEDTNSNCTLNVNITYHTILLHTFAATVTVVSIGVVIVISEVQYTTTVGSSYVI